MIIKIFIYGMLATLPIIAFWHLVEFTGNREQLSDFFSSSIYATIFYIFIGIAFFEEFLKYLVVKEKVLKDPEFDEPIDTMIYMIVAALGFAAFENLLYLSPFIMPEVDFSIKGTAILSGMRFISGTFLHALCSGTIGYFLALSIYETKCQGIKMEKPFLLFQLASKKTFFLILGIGLATFLHGLYNFSIMKLEGNLSWIIPVIILVSLATFLTFGFERLKKLKSTCKI